MTWMSALFLVTLIMGGAAFLRSTFGFGDALLAMPLLLWFLPAEEAAVLMASIGLVQGGIMLAQERRQLDLRSSSLLLVGALAGVPLGIWSLVYLSQEQIKALAGACLLIYSTQSLLHVNLPRLAHPRRWSVVAGMCAGFLGASCTMSGPPVVMFGSMARWEPEKFRATLQSFFFPLAVIIVANQALHGLWSRQSAIWIAVALPGMVVGMLAGTICRGRISPTKFQSVLNVILLLLSVTLLYPFLRAHFFFAG